MMNKKIILATLLLTSVFFSACDYIAIPKVEYTGVPEPADTVIRKVMLEDYTGHTCANCPPAHAEATALKQIYGEKLVVVGVHAGVLSDPNPPNYPANYQTTAGDAYEVFFFITGYPTGMVSRKGYTMTPQIHKITAYQSWDTHIDSVLAKPVAADIEINHTYNTGTRQLNISTSTKFLRDTIGNYWIVALITEDNIESPQLNGTNYVPLYNHRHVLRGSVPNNAPWGYQIANGSILAGDTANYDFPSFTLASGWNDNNCSIVVYVYDNNPASPTYKEILQVEEQKIR